VRLGAAFEFQTKWRTNWFAFRAFKVAVGKLFDALEPPKPPSRRVTKKDKKEWADEAVAVGNSPEWVKRTLQIKSPEVLGAFEFTRLWQRANRLGPPNQEQREIMRMLLEYERDFYTLPKAWKALELKSKTTEPRGNGND
jgi:hypothetical protein